MKIKHLFLAVMMSFLSTGCYGEITGTVVDAETGKPIEGAVILVEWTKTKGLGLTHTESYKVVEVLTDKEGKATISGTFSPFVDYPDVAVYKKGYVAWSSRIIFPDHINRTDFKWKNNYVFRLEHFKPEYSYIDHSSFIGRAINAGLSDKKIIYEAYKWERKKASKERDKRRRK